MTVEMEGGRWKRLQPRERALILIVGIIAALAVVYLLFFSGDGEPEGFAPSPQQTRSPAATASPTATPTAPPETFEVFEGKDPFKPLVSAGPTISPTPTGSPGPSGGPTGEQRVTLVEITGSGSDRTALVEVNSVEYRVQEGDTFAGSYRVKDLTAGCGTFVFGDETFTLCVGQEVLK